MWLQGVKMASADVINLSPRMENQLPPELVSLMRLAGEAAHKRGEKLYLVGGAVRDLLLERSNLDLDLVAEGDAIGLAHDLVSIEPGRITTHTRFGTAKIQWGEWSADLATARSETYRKPGALPDVKAGSISGDLFRRDFTINAMAVELSSDRYGKLLDPYGGRADLEHKLVRVLHDRSFIDDATRIWRALRYEQRLDFKLEMSTLKLLRRSLAMLDTISGDRIRHEVERVFKEASPEKVLRRAGELGVLARLHPSLERNGWLVKKFKQARQLSYPDLPPPGLYLALLTYRLKGEEIEQLISYLRPGKPAARTLRDTVNLKAHLESLASPALARSGIYARLHGYSVTAIAANWLAADSLTARERLQLYLDKLRNVKPALTGNDLQEMGVKAGPRIKEILDLLREARLDGKVSNKQEEVAFLEGLRLF
ncbi:MAG: CCA tRNA nucleotidyltransferase [Chloroflexi bacterium]|nr:CCA tRNA nucleotidyltransferase [Chloroflexota bacterium]